MVLYKHIRIICLIALFIVLTGCSAKDDISVSDLQETQTETTVPEESPNQVPKPLTFDSLDSYVDYIADVQSFQPYYRTVFAFEGLSGNVTDVPIEDVKTMYNEMKDVFDYILLSERPLIYRGYYCGETSFVYGYESEQFFQGYESEQTDDVDMGNSKVINAPSQDLEGNKILTTPLKSIWLGESAFNRFDNSIEKGRNLQNSDFKLESPNEPISVVLGSAYKDIYEIGDIFSLELISEVMDFQVVGFYKSGTSFSMDVGALHDVDLDHTIVMPHFIPEYEPIGEAAAFQHAFLIAELMSGYIHISEQVEKINDDTYNNYAYIMEEMAKENGLSRLYKIPYWPVGFVWKTAK
ncbi:hypothetical protein RBU61_05610 [Tissierella sp. MB52-C2]|uniref:hypothetical protein n=1 Tax=Tissierella sp. MB52-C2 TaxID=3070999 RepID=UPI00280A97FB|nr:hypothetical protein [Tissierella sp. MB52-C2]WMM26152.1 hypothetical protein RBU61_05610 [Tissierella sp. MB52-C2]